MPASFQWGELSSSEFPDAVSSAYDELVHWKCNLFPVPFGSSEKSLVPELSHFHQAYAEHSSLEAVAFKACSVVVALVLQKPSTTSKKTF